MKFKKGDKVQFISKGLLVAGVVKECRDLGPNMWYLIDDDCKDSWIFEGHLIPLTPLPVIPQFVADWIEKKKENGDDLLVALDKNWQGMEDSVRDWFDAEKERYELFARAWMGEYEVEQEPLYYVRLPIVRLNTLGTAVEGDYKYLWADQATGENNIFQSLEYPATLIQSGWETKFTEQEIKAIDERYWQFAIPVSEVEGK